MARVASTPTSWVAGDSGAVNAAFRAPPRMPRSRVSAAALIAVPERHDRHSTPPSVRSNATRATSGSPSPQRTQWSSSGRTPSAASSFQ